MAACKGPEQSSCRLLAEELLSSGFPLRDTLLVVLLALVGELIFPV